MSFKRLAIIVALAASHFGSAAIVQKRGVTCPTGQTTANEACCVLFPVIDLLQEELFDGGECGDEAHAALRLAFHDAIGFSKNGGKGGGADGSILTFASVETAYGKYYHCDILLPANNGIDDIVAAQLPVFQKSGLSAGDFVHLAGAIGTGNCPGAPQLPYSFGRPPPVAPAPDGTVPEPTDSVTDILARFAEAGFVPAEVIWLLASHSIASASKVDPSIPNTPFDSTPAVFDTTFYLETLLNATIIPGDALHDGEVLSPLKHEMRLASDAAFAQDSRTACLWQEPINDQAFIQGKFQAAMKKLQVLGQTNLTDCSDVIPVPAPLSSPITYPPGFDQDDVISNCAATPLPSVATILSPALAIRPTHTSVSSH